MAHGIPVGTQQQTPNSNDSPTPYLLQLATSVQSLTELRFYITLNTK